MDGPSDLLSVRLLIRETEPVRASEYSSRFLQAQAVGSVMAMRDAGRPVPLAVLDAPTDVDRLDDVFNRRLFAERAPA